MVKPTVVETYSGKFLDVANPDPDDIDIQDISVSLSRLCRFNGHTASFYPVSVHCSMVADTLCHLLACNRREPWLWGLLHDAPEAYISDIPRPVKHQFQDVKKMEDLLMLAICRKFSLPFPCPWKEELKKADDIVLVTEAKFLMPSKGVAYGLDVESRPCLFPTEEAEEKFLADFRYGNSLRTMPLKTGLRN